MKQTLQEQFGAIDIYLFDQLLKGRIRPGMRVVDAGCGQGRNLLYLLREGYEVFGIDLSSEAVEEVRLLASMIAPELPAENFKVEAVEAISLPNKFADVMVSNTVLHFARDDEHFYAMLGAMWRVLKPGGMFFCRLASSIGMEPQRCLGGRRYLMHDGTERYLVDQAMLLRVTEELGGELLEPLKTTVVQDLRCMTTWVVRKGG